MPDHNPKTPLAIVAAEVPVRLKASGYPEPFRSRMGGRQKRALGEVFGIRNFGVNLTTLAPGGESALLHRHSRQDEFVYLLSGDLVLVTDEGEMLLGPGMCAGFAANGRSHHLVNRSGREAHYLEIGDRSEGDSGYYPDDDLEATQNGDGGWIFRRKDGSPFDDEN